MPALRKPRLKWAKPKPQILTKQETAREATALERAIALRVRRRDHHRCRICGKPGRDVHHIVPKSLGGRFELSNLVTLDRACHALVQGHAIKLAGDPNGGPGAFTFTRWEA